MAARCKIEKIFHIYCCAPNRYVTLINLYVSWAILRQESCLKVYLFKKKGCFYSFRPQDVVLLEKVVDSTKKKKKKTHPFALSLLHVIEECQIYMLCANNTVFSRKTLTAYMGLQHNRKLFFKCTFKWSCFMCKEYFQLWKTAFGTHKYL